MFRSIAPWGRVRTFQILASFLVFCTLLSTLRLYRRQNPPPSIYDYTDGKTRGPAQNETAGALPLSDETAYLRYLVREYGLTNEVPWSARRIRPQSNSRARKSMTEITGAKLMPRDLRRVRADDERLDLHAEKSGVRIPVTKSATPDQLDASPLLFGISTSYDRLTYANSSLLADWARWLTDGRGASNGASLVLTLHRAAAAEIDYVDGKLREVGVDAVVLPAEDTQDSTTARHLDLVRLLARRKDELQSEGREKRFIALVDDDVFFPSLGRVLARLGKFDARKKVYVGMPSERSDWTVENNVTLTYGGGVVLFSPPMIDAISQLPCINRTASQGSSLSYGESTGQWDETLYSCITEHTDENLHILPSLYVPGDDLYGLRTGYEGGVQPLVLHHYKHRHRFEAGKAHAVTSLCGEDCFLQRFFFRDDGWVLVNGHSVSQYPDGVDVLPLSKTSLQLQHNNNKINDNDINKNGGARNGNGNVNQVRVGERLVLDKEDSAEKRLESRQVVSWAGTKRTWRLLDSRAGLGGEVWQAYVKRRGSPVTYGDEDDRLPEGDTVHTQDGPSDVDSVIVLIWEP
ncbi:glycosyltransferase family 31 protein [Hypoxylon sp. NC1633]|nr:glycosyltransferase family 31 protein [Hypoxylon sp. NC1633]